MWKLTADERVARWHDFRKTLDALPLDEALQEVAKFWQGCPFVPYYLDPDEIDNWPDPWTLIYENIYCDIAKCLGIVYTIELTQHKKNLAVEIRVYKDPDTGHEYNLAWFNQGKYIINLIENTVVNNTQFDKRFTLVKQYTAEDISLDKYNN